MMFTVELMFSSWAYAITHDVFVIENIYFKLIRGSVSILGLHLTLGEVSMKPRYMPNGNVTSTATDIAA